MTTHEIVSNFDFVASDKLYQAATTDYIVKGYDQTKDTITRPAIMTV